MERIDVVARAAQRLRARLGVGSGLVPARSADLIERACDTLGFTVTSDGAATMLGGAYARLQLWFADLPEQGGQIWVRGDLDARERAFAIAHELGHFALHRGEAALHAPCDEAQVDPTTDAGALRIEQHRVEEYSPRVRRELEANAFAAELLAPRAQVRHHFAHRRDASAGAIAALFGIAPALAARRLLDAVLAPAPSATMLEAGDVPIVESGGEAEARTRRQAVLDALDASQRAAAAAQGPALVVAGPGTGKTATLVGRVAHLVSALSVAPERVLALTFSNLAAGEMRDRLERAGLPGAQMPVMTIHAFAAELLRRYPSKVPCGPDDTPLRDDYRILDNADAFLLMEELLAELPLRFYRSLGNPTAHLRTLLDDFSHARDQLLSPEAYLALVAAMPPMPSVAAPTRDGAEAPTRKSKHAAAHPPAGTFTPEQIEKARERALAYGVWDRALRQRGLLDFGGLIQRAVELLRADAQVLAEVRASFPHVLVDEFQDTNRAAGELLLLVAGERGAGLWVVGDRNQSIYRWRGASPGNVARLRERYPVLAEYSLDVCYRSVPAIVALGSALAARMWEAGAAEGAGLADARRPGALRAARAPGDAAAARGERFATAAQEYAGLGVEVARQCAAGRGYSDQAILCRGHRQTAHIAAALAAQGLPVALPGDFFERPEIKDALALAALAAGPDARGLLRAGALLLGLGHALDDPRQLALAARGLADARQALPGALTTAALDGVGGVSPATRGALAVLGAQAQGLRRGQGVGAGLADYLLRPDGYAWRLVRAADGLDARGASELAACWSTGAEPHGLAVAEAQTALTALGELVRLALRFDGRWVREPDFRARLSRAVTHGRTVDRGGSGAAGRPHAADALEAVSGADVAAPGAGAASSAAGVETAPAVSCLLHYLGALRAADATIALPAGTSDAVHVMTLHASKGLEFPIVYLPGLAEGRFPNTRAPREEVCPPGLREDDTPGEREAEERCLFYVGLTRARDRVVLTRAASYGAGRASKPRGPSPLLALLDDAPEWQRAQPLFDDETLARLPVVDVETPEEAPEEADEQDSEEEPAATATPAAGGAPLPGRDAAQTQFALSDLELYLECPRRYKYATRYRLLDPADDAVRRFHRYVRSGGRVLREVHTAAPQADWEAAEARLRAHWEAEGPAGHAYDAFYWRHAQAILRRQWDALCGAADAGTATIVAEPLVAQLHGCRVATLVDRVEGAPPPWATPLGTPVVLVRQHTGRPNKEHADQLCVSLYYLGYRQHHPDADVRIELAYAGDALVSERPEDAGTRSGENVDVTEQARKVAERYVQPGRAARSKLDKLDDAAAGIAAGRFEPHPDERRCAVCPYRIVCPADPDEAGMAALAHT